MGQRVVKGDAREMGGLGQLDPGLQTQILNAGKAASFTINTIQNSMSPQVWGAYLENIDALVLGEITAEQFCQALAAAAE